MIVIAMAAAALMCFAAFAMCLLIAMSILMDR